MSFFGNDTPANGEFNAGGGNFEPIPNNTEVLATADQAEWSEYDGERYINIKWVVLAPDEYKNRILFQKLYVLDNKPKSKDPIADGKKAKNMLAAIDYNASGGKLVQSGQEPTDETLSQFLCHSPMYLKLMVWKMDKERDGTPIPEANQKKGNWVQAVAPKNKQPAKQQEAPAANNKADDNIPF